MRIKSDTPYQDRVYSDDRDFTCEDITLTEYLEHVLYLFTHNPLALRQDEDGFRLSYTTNPTYTCIILAITTLNYQFP